MVAQPLQPHLVCDGCRFNKDLQQPVLGAHSGHIMHDWPTKAVAPLWEGQGTTV